MNRKYEFVDNDTITTEDGRTLRRIRALVDIADSVKSGDLGGYIEGEHNLNLDLAVPGDGPVLSNAWVYGDAKVYGNAWVFGNAQVGRNARVSGDARVFGNAKIRNRNMIFWVSNVGNENGTLTVYNGRDGELLVTRGCFSGTAEEFLAKSAEVHDERIQREYRLLIEVARSRIEAAQETTAKAQEA